MNAEALDSLDTDSFGRLLPEMACRISLLMPRRDVPVVLYLCDPDVAIHGLPVVGWNSGTKDSPRRWTGVPASYIDLLALRWTVTHWAPLPGDEASTAAIIKAKSASSAERKSA